MAGLVVVEHEDVCLLSLISRVLAVYLQIVQNLLAVGDVVLHHSSLAHYEHREFCYWYCYVDRTMRWAWQGTGKAGGSISESKSPWLSSFCGAR